MGDIPTILSQRDISTGSTGPTASPDDFGVGPAIQRFGANLQGDVQQAAHAIGIKQRVDNIQWAGESVEQEKNYINKWMADSENNTKDTFADDLQKLGKERISEYSGKAPSTKALQMFKTHMLSFIGERYESALQTGVKNQLTGAALSIDTQSGNAMDAYRNAKDVPGVDARKGLMDSVSQIHDNIAESFGKSMPQLAQKLHEKLDVDATYATMHDDPELARKILSSNKTLDEHERSTITDRIDASSMSKNVAEHVAFDQMRSDRLTSVYNGKTRDKLGLTLYQPYYTRDQALAQKMKDDAQIDTFNRANDFTDKIKSWNSDDQVREATTLRRGITTSQDSDVSDIVDRKVRTSIQLQEKNPISWLQQNNSVVAEALKRVQASTDKQRIQAMGELYDLQLKYQGPPPLNLDTGKLSFETDPVTGYAHAISLKEDRHQYLGKASNDRHLMTQEEAEQNADQINMGSPSEMLDNIKQVMSRYSDAKHQDIAFNDMVTLPKQGSGIKQEYQLAFLNQNAHWVKEYLGAIQHSDALKNIDNDKKQDFEKALSRDPTFLQFSHSIMGDDFQRGNIVDGFKRGIMSYAIARASQKNESPELAIKSASNMLINEELGFASVHGQTIVVQKNRGPGQPPRGDDQIKLLGPRLEQSLSFIDPREIKLTDDRGGTIFPGFRQPISEKLKMQKLRNFITQRGFFQTSADGQSATLYGMGDDKRPFEFRDKNNQAFELHFDDVIGSHLWDTKTTTFQGTKEFSDPRMQEQAEANRSFAPWFPSFWKRNPEIYNIGDLNRTNWPIDPGYIHRIQR